MKCRQVSNPFAELRLCCPLEMMLGAFILSLIFSGFQKELVMAPSGLYNKRATNDMNQ